MPRSSGGRGFPLQRHHQPSTLTPSSPMKKRTWKLEQISATHPGILDLLGDPGNPLYAEPHSMAEHFDTMMLGACSVGQLPNRGHCRDPEALTHVYEDEVQQAFQKILCCLDVRVLDGDLVVPTCLRMPSLILPIGRFMQLYYNPDAQG